MHSAVVASCLGCVLATPAVNRNIQLSGTVVPDIGTLQGFTYPRMGGTKGDQVTFGAYSKRLMNCTRRLIIRTPPPPSEPLRDLQISSKLAREYCKTPLTRPSWAAVG